MEEKEFDVATLLTSKPKIDRFSLIIFFLMICAVIAVAYFIVLEKVNSCTSDPIGYGVEKIKENTDADYVYGSLSIRNKDSNAMIIPFGDEIEFNYTYQNISLIK